MNIAMTRAAIRSEARVARSSLARQIDRPKPMRINRLGTTLSQSAQDIKLKFHGGSPLGRPLAHMVE